MDRFDFCPERMVPKTLPPETSGKSVSMNGWSFSSKPNVPYQKSFNVKLNGMTWYLAGNGLFDSVTNPKFNARRLEEFYEKHGTWDPFEFPHPHFGMLICRFKTPVTVPEAMVNSDGLIEGFEVQLVHHNPGF